MHIYRRTKGIWSSKTSRCNKQYRKLPAIGKREPIISAIHILHERERALEVQ
jgi:hypothetical protein